VVAGEALDHTDDLARADPGQRRAVDGGGRIHVVADDDERPAVVLDAGHRAQGDHLAAGVADLEPPHVLGPHAEGRVGLHVHLPGPAELVEVVHVEPAQVHLEGLEHLAQRHAHGLALGAIDVDVQLGRVGAEHGGQAGQAGRLVSLLDQVVGLGLEDFQALVAAVFDHHLEAAGGAQAADRRRAEDEQHAVLDLAELLANGLEDRVGAALGLQTLVEGLERDEHRAQVRTVGPQHERHPTDADDMADAGDLADQPGRPAHHLLGPLQRRGIGELGRHEQVALVLVGNEADGHAAEAPARQVQQPDVNRQRHQAHAEQLSHGPRIPADGCGERPIEEPEEPAEAEVEGPRERVAVGVPLLQQEGTQRGAERQRVQRGEDRGKGDGQRELAKEPTRNPRDENARNEHAGEHQPDGDHRGRDLVHGLARRVARPHPLLDVVLGGLDHHDGVVDHDADRQHQAEQGERVQAEPEGRHGGERADDRHRHGNQRDHRGAPVLQEDQHDNRHQGHRVAERLEDLVDRLGDVGGGVVVDAVVEPLGKPLLEHRHLRLDPLGRGQGVRAGQLEYADAGRGVVVEIVGHVLALRAQLDAAHVAQARDLSLRPGLDHDVGELLRLGEPAQRAHRVLEVHAGGGRLLPDPAGRHLDVLLAEGRDHVAGRHAAGGQQRRIQPHPHAVVALAEDDHLAHPFQPRQLVPQLDHGVVAHVELVVLPAGRDQVDDHHQVGRPLQRGYAGLLDRVGEHGQGQGHAVLHEHLRHVRVGAHLERHIELVRAVVAALRRHVEHVFHAVDLLFDGRGHGVGHHLGTGARVGAGDPDRGGRHLRILRHRQRKRRHQAQQRHHDRGHRGEDGAIDEETREHRRVGSIVRSGRRA